MVLYTCPRCGYNNTIKTHMKKHFMRKTLCKPTNKNIDITQCFYEVLGESIGSVTLKSPSAVTLCNPNVTLNNKNVTLCNPNITQRNPNVTLNDPNMHICLYCNKEFKRRQHKWRHERNCKERITYTKEEVAEAKAEVAADKDKVIDELKNQIEVLLTKVGNTTNNNTININKIVII